MRYYVQDKDNFKSFRYTPTVFIRNVNHNYGISLLKKDIACIRKILNAAAEYNNVLFLCPSLKGSLSTIEWYVDIGNYGCNIESIFKLIDLNMDSKVIITEIIGTSWWDLKIAYSVITNNSVFIKPLEIQKRKDTLDKILKQLR